MIPDKVIKSSYFIICIILSVNIWAQTSFNISFSLTSEVVGPSVTHAAIHLGSPTDFTAGGVPSSMFSNMGISLDTPKIKGNKLVGTGAVGDAQQGYSVSISADGNTAIVGGYGDDGNAGAVWVYRYKDKVWRQDGNKLVGSGTIGNVEFGESVALSADGNTAIVGGPGDDNSKGAIWIFRYLNGVWSQEGDKLVGPCAKGDARQGRSVSISADGNIVIFGGPSDDSDKGAAWIFRYSNGIWQQDGSKLVGLGATESGQGMSVSLSADGSTAIVGGPFDDGNVVWIYRYLKGEWLQEGSKLVGMGANGKAWQGISVSLSADGNTAIVGGPRDQIFRGAVWVYRYVNGIWRQDGNKLVGSGAKGNAWQGDSVSLSADGNTAVVGGHGTDGGKGAFWVYRYLNGIWVQDGKKLIGSRAKGYARQGTSVSLSGDGNTAIVGGPGDNGDKGAVWIYRYENGVWVQY
jgi:hypothetical protein